MTSSSNNNGAPSSPPHTSTSGHAMNHAHRPSVPSGLRQSHMLSASPESTSSARGHEEHGEEDATHVPEVENGRIRPYTHDFHNGDSGAISEAQAEGEIEEPPGEPTARTRLLSGERKYRYVHDCGDPECDHGTFSLRPRNQLGYGSMSSEYNDQSTDGRRNTNDGAHHSSGEARTSYRGDFVDGTGDSGESWPNGFLRQFTRRGTVDRLAAKYGVKRESWLYLLYYIPFTNWIQQYRWSYLKGDLIAALTMASFYIPMALSLASNLGHIPPINGLYTFAVNPLIYALLGTCPQMVVGPEAAGSLLTGSVVKEAIKAGTHLDNDDLKHAQVAGMVTGLAGAFIFIAGICRLGFLEGVLSRPFLRGFISAIGITILVDQLIPEMGLTQVAKGSNAAQHGSSLDKILFLFRHGHEAHKLTCAVSFSTIAIVLFLREIKRRLQPRFPSVAYVPDRFVVVVLSAVFAWRFEWESKGLALTGDISAEGAKFRVHFPFDEANFRHVEDAFSTAFIISLLGFFESSVAAKSLGNSTGKTRKVRNKQDEEVEEYDGIKDLNLSSNRELVALGVANLLGGLFMALPGFGGYGRSKVNASTGGKTPMSSVFLALITIVCIFFLLPYFYYIPKGVLSAMISVVAYSLIEEAPHDIRYFLRISGYIELALMTLIFLATFFWNLKIGIAVGIGLSLLRLLKHSTRPRIQILGRVPGTNEFESAELYGRQDGSGAGDGVVMVPHCLIVKIPEPLTFANTGSLKDRLRRLEDHGTTETHPAFPRSRSPEHNENIIFDVHGVTKLDPAASQVLLEIVQGYVDRGVRVFFCRLPSRRTEVWRLMQVSGIVDICGGESHFLASVDDALHATEMLNGTALQNVPSNGPESGRRHTWAAIFEDDGQEGVDLERA